jgi:iron complex outermembrane receptor protein
MLVAPVLRAEDVAPEASAHDHALQLFSEGKTAYKQGDLQTAIKDLEAAYELEPAPVLLYNLARAYEGLGELEKAVSAYERFLTAQPNAEDRGAIETRLATLKRQVDERAQRQVSSSPEPARPPVVVPRSPSIAPIFVLATGATGLLLGGIFGGLALSENNTQNDPATPQVNVESAHDRAGSFAVASDIGFIAGGALVAAGAVWLILDRTYPNAQSRAGAPFVIRF